MSIQVTWHEVDLGLQNPPQPVTIRLGYDWQLGVNQLRVSQEVEKVRFLDHNTLAVEYKGDYLEIPDGGKCDITLAVWDETGTLKEVWCMPDAMLYGGGKNWLLQTSWYDVIKERTKFLGE